MKKEMTLKEFATKGGHARKQALTPERRSEIASYAVFVREQKRKAKQAELDKKANNDV